MAFAFTAVLRSKIEGALAHRIPSALSPQALVERRVSPSGIAALDDLLGGGLPVGAITELVGTASSGRTSLALSAVAGIQQQDHFAAWVDAGDAFDPESAAASGVLLERLLWVRCGVVNSPIIASEEQAPNEQPVHWVVPGMDKPVACGGCNSPHPRGEVRGLPEAVSGFLQQPASAYRRDKTIGTPGVRNLPLRDPAYRKEQPNSDRHPARRGNHAGASHRVALVRDAESVPRQRAKFQRVSKPWDRMDQALRAVDLLLAAGGFGMLVLDFGGIAPQAINRVPLATWFRLRAAAERSRAVLLLLTQHPSAHSSAEALLRTHAKLPPTATIMPALDFQVSLERRRFQPQSNVVPLRKPVQSDHTTAWSATQRWAGTR